MTGCLDSSIPVHSLKATAFHGKGDTAKAGYLLLYIINNNPPHSASNPTRFLASGDLTRRKTRSESPQFPVALRAQESTGAQNLNYPEHIEIGSQIPMDSRARKAPKP